VITDLDVGGAERMLVNYLTSSAEIAGCSAVFSLKRPGAMAEPLRAAGIPVYDGAIAEPSEGLLTTLGSVPGGIGRLKGLISDLRPTAVVGWMYHANVLAYEALRLSGRRAETRLVAGIRCSAMQGNAYGVTHRLVVARSRQISGAVDVLAYNSEAGRHEHEALGFSPAKATVVWNGVDTNRFRPDAEARARIRQELGIAPDRRVLVQAARVDPMKDYPTLLKAFRALEGAADLMVVGKGTEALPDLPGLHRLGIRTDMPPLYATADVIVMSSAFGEGFPNVVAEGMAAGLVPAVTRVGDAAIIGGDVGRTVAPGDVAGLADALSGLVGLDADGLAAAGAAARQRIVTEFSLPAAVARMSNIIDPAS